MRASDTHFRVSAHALGAGADTPEAVIAKHRLHRKVRCANFLRIGTSSVRTLTPPNPPEPLNLFSHRLRKKEPFGSRLSAFIQGSSIFDSKDGGVPYSPNQRARREEQKFSLSIRNPTEGA
jgi:hypothetical protein